MHYVLYYFQGSSMDSSLTQLWQAIKIGREKNQWSPATIFWHKHLDYVYMFPLFSPWLGVSALMMYVWCCAGSGDCAFEFFSAFKNVLSMSLLPRLHPQQQRSAVRYCSFISNFFSFSVFVFTPGTFSLCTRWVGGRDVQTISLFLVTL